jgi:hypothetical protein
MRKKYFTEEERKEAIKKRYIDNREQILIRQKIYDENNREKKKLYSKIWYQQNKEKRLLQCKKYRQNNKEITNQYFYKRKKTDINYKLISNLRTRMYHAVKNNQKSGSAVRDLGCSISEFKLYLELKFQEGMNWENWGIHGWHIDHIQPLDSFDLTNREEFLKACHYTNLQPLWAEENLKKSDKSPK